MERQNEQQAFIDAEGLEAIRRSVDWALACAALGIAFDERKSKPNDWWAHSPFSEDRTPSFHVQFEKGVWYCFSTRTGGGILELVQKVRELNCYDAARWLIDEGCCPEPGAGVDLVEQAVPAVSDAVQGVLENAPIRQSLVPQLSGQGEHEIFRRRGISAATCFDLGCGFLGTSKSRLMKRIVFQVRGIMENLDGVKAVILSHIGRATTSDQEETDGKWLFYAGFRKSSELYNIDLLLLDDSARAQVSETGRVIIVEGPFDVAKLWEAGIKNVVGAFGSALSPDVLPRLEMIGRHLPAQEYVVWFDRDQAGAKGQSDANALLREAGHRTATFDWEQRFGRNNQLSIPKAVADPCDMSVEQLRWLRAKNII